MRDGSKVGPLRTFANAHMSRSMADRGAGAAALPGGLGGVPPDSYNITAREPFRRKGDVGPYPTTYLAIAA
jgi:hypothetical protein